jgi:hypothetical protein
MQFKNIFRVAEITQFDLGPSDMIDQIDLSRGYPVKKLLFLAFAWAGACGSATAGHVPPKTPEAGSSGSPVQFRRVVAAHRLNRVPPRAELPGRDTVSFSSSSRPAAGVNHPPKK